MTEHQLNRTYIPFFLRSLGLKPVDVCEYFWQSDTHYAFVETWDKQFTEVRIYEQAN